MIVFVVDLYVSFVDSFWAESSFECFNAFRCETRVFGAGELRLAEPRRGDERATQALKRAVAELAGPQVTEARLCVEEGRRSRTG